MMWEKNTIYNTVSLPPFPLLTFPAFSLLRPFVLSKDDSGRKDFFLPNVLIDPGFQSAVHFLVPGQAMPIYIQTE